MSAPLVVSPVRDPADLSPTQFAALDRCFEASRSQLVPSAAHLEPWAERASEASVDPERHLWVATAGSNVVGGLDGRAHWPGPGTWTVSQMAVNPKDRGRGVGTALVWAGATAGEAGWAQLSAHLVEGDARSEPFWQKLGFAHTDGQLSDLPRPTGSVLRVDDRNGSAPEAAFAVREKVFVHEQGVPRALEWDGLDASSWHVWVDDHEGSTLGAARLRFPGEGRAKVQRVCVLPEARGRGLGQVLMRHLESVARRNQCCEIQLHAQCAVETFYAQLGYRSVGPIFEEAGIRHVAMTRTLSTDWA